MKQIIPSLSTFINENTIEDKIEEIKSKIWEIDNMVRSWIPTDPNKKREMKAALQSKIEKLNKKLEK
jgi:hypothetical protein